MFGFSVAFHSSSAGLSKVKKSYVKLGQSYGKLQKLQTGTAIPHGDVRALAAFTKPIGVISNRKEAFGQMHGEIPQAHGGRPRSSGPYTSTKRDPGVAQTRSARRGMSKPHSAQHTRRKKGGDIHDVWHDRYGMVVRHALRWHGDAV